VLAAVFESAATSYEREAQAYRRFFDRDALEELQDDPNAFKQALARDVPVIARTLRQQRAELREWQGHFRRARSKDLLEIFTNVLEFAEEWSSNHPPSRYEKLDTPEAFELDPLDTDETMSMANVIGMGIKSLALYHLDPERFPPRGRTGAYAFFFLSNRDRFDLPSDSSEFLMIDDVHLTPDGNMIMEYNYWYPYGLFSLYSLRTFRWMKKRAAAAGLTLDNKLRYVYVTRFFEAVYSQHSDDVKTMRAHERFEVLG
jgi:hypothetical protein